MNKNDLVHLLTKKHGYKSCLVLRTKLTGPDCKIDEKMFHEYHYVCYKCPGSDFGVDGGKWFTSPRGYYDVALLDPWHSYDDSLRDLRFALASLRDGGALVCHDCWPRFEITEPNGWDACMRGGEWSGVTFMAWVDFALKQPYRYCTIDSDYGCGVVLKEPNKSTFDGKNWEAFKCSHSAAHAYLSTEGMHLLNLIKPSSFEGWLDDTASSKLGVSG